MSLSFAQSINAQSINPEPNDSANAQAINIIAHGFDNKNLAAFKYAFKQFKSYQLNLLEHHAHETGFTIYLFDIDNPQAKEAWMQLDDKEQLQAIVVSYQGLERINDKTLNGLILSKPLSVEKLFEAINHFIEPKVKTKLGEAQTSTPGITHQESQKTTQTQEPIACHENTSDEKSSASTAKQKDEAMQEKTAADNTSTANLSPTLSLQLTPQSFFNPEQGLLGTLIEIHQQKTAVIVYLSYDKRVLLYVIPEQNEVYIRASGSDLKKICERRLKVEYSQLELHSFDPDKITQAFKKSALDKFIWLIAIVTSQGRFPNNIDPGKQALGLKLWPNLTRYKSNTNFLRFAAFFSQTPTTLIMANKLLQAPQAQLANFISACFALGLLEVKQEKLSEGKPVKPQKAGIRVVVSQLFSRLSRGFNKKK